MNIHEGKAHDFHFFWWYYKFNKMKVLNSGVFHYRISDRGGGVPHANRKKIWNYNFTTSGAPQEENGDQNVLDDVMNAQHMSGAVPGKMHGYVVILFPTISAHIDHF